MDQSAAVRLFVGGHAGTIKGEREDLVGDRCFSSAHRPQAVRLKPDRLNGLLDSGAFTDPPERRLTPEQALERQFAFEQTAARIWGFPWQAYALVSYDLLIDETWIAGERHKRRWTVQQADWAVRETVEATAYLVSQRQALLPRTLVLSCQGVDPLQYAECAAEILRYARPGDWFGLGGWCILGRQTRWLPSFWATIQITLPMVAYAGIDHVHIFGVLWQKALGGLVWLADQYGISISTDSSAPILACTWANSKKAGCRAPYWRDNVRWWLDTLTDLRASQWYRRPPDVPICRQLALL